MHISTNLSLPASAPAPEQTDARLASSALRCGVRLRVVAKSRAKYDRGAFVGYESLPGHDASAGGEAEGLGLMQVAVGRALAPTPVEQIEPWLAELSVIAPSRQHDPLTDELRMTAYSSRLSAYPVDVVRHVLLGRVWRFWPSWAELFDACEAAVSPRRAMAAALEDALARRAQDHAAQPEPPVPEEPEQAAARRARVHEIVQGYLGRHGRTG